jgi:hypothetical protein
VVQITQKDVKMELVVKMWAGFIWFRMGGEVV